MSTNDDEPVEGELVPDPAGATSADPLAGLRDHPAGPIRVVGLVISRQRPETAKGFVFLALEDETGIANVVIRPALFDRQARIITTAPVLYVEGTLERRDDVVNVIARTLKPVRGLPSR